MAAACCLVRGRSVVPLFRPSISSRFLRGNVQKPRHAGEMKTLEDVMAESKKVDDLKLAVTVDIGFPFKMSRSWTVTSERVNRRKVRNEELEKAARLKILKIPLEEVYAEWSKSVAAKHIKSIAEHYGIYEDLFRGAYFFPQVPLDISYSYDGDVVSKVFRGNHIKPSEATSVPEVQFDATPDSLWTLVMTNPDGHLEDSSAEYVHWMVGNISHNDIATGETVCDYLQPFPAKGSGFHRYIFILFKQECRVDFSSMKKSSPCLRLRDRTFRTFDFYRELQDELTPAGLAFFQSEWDETLTDFFHHTLRMREPIFEYDAPPPYITPQVYNAKNHPFNLYLEKYRDPKDIEEEILLKRFKNVHPFQPEPEKPLYPNLEKYTRGIPRWLQTEQFKERLRIGKYRGLDVTIFKPERPVRPRLGVFRPVHLQTDDNVISSK